MNRNHVIPVGKYKTRAGCQVFDIDGELYGISGRGGFGPADQCFKVDPEVFLQDLYCGTRVFLKELEPGVTYTVHPIFFDLDQDERKFPTLHAGYWSDINGMSYAGIKLLDCIKGWRVEKN